MGQIISSIYVFLKYSLSLCPPCIEQYSEELPELIINLTEVTLDVPPEEIKVDVPPPPPPAEIKVDLSANTVNPIISKEKKPSLSKILRYKYHLSIEKSNILSEQFRTLKAILNLTEAELAECKTSSGRRFGKSIAKQTYNMLHP